MYQHFVLKIFLNSMLDMISELKSIQDCLIKLEKNLWIRLLAISIFSLNHVIIRLAKIKGLSVKEDYDYLWVVHNFDVKIFEFWVVLFLLLSGECEVSFYWGPAWVKFDSSLFWNCLFTTEKNCRAGISNFNINEFSCTTGNQM